MPASDYRSHFPVTGEWAYFNHAAVAPISKPAHDRILEWAGDMARQGNVHEPDWYREVETVRELSADFLGAGADEIALLKNTSEGLSLVAQGLDWRAGDSVVTVAGEFPANVYPWLQLESRGVSVRVVQPRERGRVQIEDLADAVDESTRLLTISWVQYASGFRCDPARLGALCRDRGVLFCLDAIQGLGVFPIDVHEMHVDFLAADGHKWLLAPEGAAIFYVRRDLQDRLRPLSLGWKSVADYADYAKIDFRYPPSAARYECGSMNIPGIVGMGASIRLLNEVGIREICERVRRITDHLIERLHEIGASVYSPRGETGWSGIVSFELPDREPRRVKKHCLERNVVLSHRDGRLRASPHFYNNEDDVSRLIDALNTAPAR